MAALYGIANFANDFNKVRDESLYSGFEAKNKMRADYLADYAMPAALNALDNKALKEEQDLMANLYGFSDKVNGQLFKNKNNVLEEQQKLVTNLYGFKDKVIEGLDKAKYGALTSNINLKKLQAQDEYEKFRQEAIRLGKTNPLDIQRHIYVNVDKNLLASNPYLASLVYDKRFDAEKNNLQTSAGLGIPDGGSNQFVSAYGIQLGEDGSIFVKDREGNVRQLPANAGIGNVVAGLYGEPSGLIQSQNSTIKHSRDMALLEEKGQQAINKEEVKAQSRNGTNPTTDNTSSIIFGNGGNGTLSVTPTTPPPQASVIPPVPIEIPQAVVASSATTESPQTSTSMRQSPNVQPAIIAKEEKAKDSDTVWIDTGFEGTNKVVNAELYRLKKLSEDAEKAYGINRENVIERQQVIANASQQIASIIKNIEFLKNREPRSEVEKRQIASLLQKEERSLNRAIGMIDATNGSIERLHLIQKLNHSEANMKKHRQAVADFYRQYGVAMS